MRKRMVIVIVVFVVAMLLIFAPLLTGIYFQREYSKIISFYKTNPQLHIEIVKYNKHWFHSTAILKIKILQSDFLEHFLKEYPREFVLEQSIQHGPIIYANASAPSFLGLAAIHNSLKITPEIKNFFQKIGADTLLSDDDFVTFNGNYYKHLKLSAIHAVYPQSNIHTQVKELEATFWLWPTHERISGIINISDFSITDDQASITAPKIIFHFDQQFSVPHFWLGNNMLEIPEIKWVEEDMEVVKVTEINFNGFVEEKSGMLTGTRQLNVGKIIVDDNQVGPIHLQLSVDKLDAVAANTIMQTYNAIMRRGELYQSQLKQNMYRLLPSLITLGASVTLNELEVITPEGKLQIRGELNWLLDKTTTPENVFDLLLAANAKLDLNVSKALLEKCIMVVSSYSLFNQPSLDLQQRYRITRDELFYALQQNASIIINLAQQSVLSDIDAEELFSLQKQIVSMSEYSDALQKLLLDKVISLETSHILLLSYAWVQIPAVKLSELIKQKQENNRHELEKQLADWIQLGYVKQEQGNYTVKISQGNDGIKINEKLISN